MANETHYCSALMPMDPDPEELKRAGPLEAALLRSTKWRPGQSITVRFLDGDPALRQRVEAVAKEWTRPGRANLQLVFVDSGPADIRIAFQQGKGSWSLIGTDCRRERQKKPTMNFGWVKPDTPEDQLRRVVLHEFGHALGLIHEHQSPDHPIQWNKAAVYADLKNPPNKWSKSKVDRNMFDLYKNVSSTPVDPLSIMMYPIPASWTLDGFSAGFNPELSPQDEALIAREYP